MNKTISSCSVSFGASLFNKEATLGTPERFPLNNLSKEQWIKLQNQAKRIGDSKDIIVVDSLTRDSEVTEFHNVGATYYSHDAKKYNGAIDILTEKKFALNKLDLPEEIFKTMRNVLKQIKNNLKQLA